MIGLLDASSKTSGKWLENKKFARGDQNKSIPRGLPLVQLEIVYNLLIIKELTLY